MKYELGSIDNKSFPLVVQYVDSPNTSASDVTNWVRSMSGQFTDWLNEYGAVLLRGFPMASEFEFGDVVKAFGGKDLEYLGGIVPRTRISKSVYTSTELNNKYKIKIHQEMAYQSDYPDRQLFFCHTPPEVRGETPICDMRKTKSMIDPSVIEKLRSKNIKYVQVLHNRDNRKRELLKKYLFLYVHLTWQETFGSESKEDVEALCKEKEFDVEWLPNGDLKISVVLPAFRTHPMTGEEVYFNHLVAQHFNKLALKSDLGDIVYYFRKLIYRDISEHPNQVYYGDGEHIPFSDMASIYQAVNKNTVAFKWQQGDLLVIDNLLSGHGRNSYRGKRKILVSLQRHGEYAMKDLAA